MPMHHIHASAETVRFGVIDPAFAPVLTVRSGDCVVGETWSMWGNAAGPDLTMDRVAQLRTEMGEMGPHALTGPICVEGAEPGHVLRVDIQRLVVGDHGFNLVPRGGGRGLLAERFPDGYLSHFTLDAAAQTTRLGDVATIPLRPFLGVMGVAPEASGQISSTAPGAFGGNIDCPCLVEGTTLYLPVWRSGAGFYFGDAHAAQGCGEVSQTALETTAKQVELRLTLLTDCCYPRPRAETADHLVTMGFAQDLETASKQAVACMVSWLSERYGLAEADAYVLTSLQGDLMVTQVVNKIVGIHMTMPKAIFTAEAKDRTDDD